MGPVNGTRPLPAIAVAVLAVLAAAAGTAFAGTAATTSAINKKKVKKIARAQITNLAPTLSVAEAANAGALGGKPPDAYASPTTYRTEQLNTTFPSMGMGDTKNVTVSCNPGETAIAGGGTASSPDLVMTSSWPDSEPKWHIGFHNTGAGAIPSPQIVAFVICASD